MGNGQKAQMRRERNAKDAGGAAKSQLKATFLCTIRAKNLEEHASNKHGKGLQDCFPGFVETPKK
ncbi:hypothetical protein BGW42_005762 [Actinomortierella wolfii]|nr:hypothetical protein BGW42_005762 [Actinomortierella wolfii]